MTPYTLKQLRDIKDNIKTHAICPLKYAYFGVGAKRYENLLRSGKYDLGISENELLYQVLNKILHRIGKNTINIVDIGCGDGSKALIFLNKLKEYYTPIRYYPIDISSTMLDTSKRTVMESGIKVKVKPHLVDFEKGDILHITGGIKSGKIDSNLLLFLGHSLGNVINKHGVLGNLRNSMDANDFLLIGIEMARERAIDRLIETYSTKEMNELVFTTLEYLGVTKNDNNFKTNYDLKNNEITIYYNFDSTHVKIIRHIKFHITKEANISLATSCRFNAEKIKTLLSDSRLSIAGWYASDNRLYSLILCKTVS